MGAARDYTVVGAGVAGLLVSLLLAERGYRVRLVEARYPGAGATGAAAGLIVLHLHDEVLPLALESLDIYSRLAGRGMHLVDVGALVFTPSRDCAMGYLRVMREAGLGARLVDVDEATEAAGVPLRVGDDEYVLHVDEYLVDVGGLVSRLYSILGELGVETSTRPAGPGGGEVIIAAGAWSHTLLPELRDRVIVYRCQASSYEAPRPRVAIEDDTYGYYAVTHPGGDLVAGDGSNTVVESPDEAYTPDQWEPYRILEEIARRIPGAEHGYPRRTWSAPCSTTPDSLPLAGTVREGVHVITGLDGLGITLAGGVAAWLVDYLEGRRRSMGPLDPWREMPLRPGRPPEPYDRCPNP